MGSAHCVCCDCRIHLLVLSTDFVCANCSVGSGSACRSLMGGFVRWSKGERDDGVDSLASQVGNRAGWAH